MSDPGVTSLDLLGLIRAGWRRSALIAALTLAAAVTYALLAPKWYLAELSVVPSVTPKSGGGGMGASAVAAALDLPIDLGGGGGAGGDVERIAAVLRSTSVTDAVIAKFNLKARYEVKFLEDARIALWTHCSTKVERKPGLVSLSCEDRDPQIAKGMVEFFGEYGNVVFRRVSVSSAAEERRFLEKRVAEARKDLDEAARKRREFQEKNKIIDLTEQSRAVVSTMANLRAELVSKEVQVSYLGSFSSRDESSAEQLHRQIEALRTKLQALEETRVGVVVEEEDAQKKGRKARARDGSGGIFPTAMSVPRLRFELENLFREQKVQETLFLLLTQRYETARVSEARDTSTFQVLDAPTLPTRRARPKRFVIAATGLLLGLGLGLGFVLVPAWWRSLPKRGAGRAA
jgi:uncharacterized protein involved in exopolysaccharide biosynthesis